MLDFKSTITASIVSQGHSYSTMWGHAGHSVIGQTASGHSIGSAR